MKIIIYRMGLCMILSLLIVSCRTGNENSLVKSEKIVNTVNAGKIRENYSIFLKNSNRVHDSIVDRELAKIKYDIEFVKITYKAIDPFGNTRTLSGLIGYPKLPEEEKDKKLSIVSVQHGTLSFESDAPSYNKFHEDASLKDALCLIPPTHENGYIIVIPDYFGYGSDEKELHYYEVRSSLAEATRKMIEAAEEFAKSKSLALDPTNLYLFGYSEGGFATMSTLKSFSENPGNFSNFVTVAGAGAYDKRATALEVVQQTKGDSPRFTASYLWVLLTYNNVYGINRDLDKLVQPDTKNKIEKYIDTDKIMQIENIPSEPINVFNPDFVRGLVDGTDAEFINALNDNNVSDFYVNGSVELVHGTHDTWVPTLNTDSTFARLQKRGVKTEKFLFEGGTHSTTYPIFVIKALEKL